MKLFTSFPYLATRIEGPMQHLMLLPETYDEARLRRLQRKQTEANRLPSALVLSESRAIYLDENLSPPHTGVPPTTGMPIADRLAPCEAFPRTPAFERRLELLAQWMEEHRQRTGFFVSRRPEGEPATERELETLSERQYFRGPPKGLVRCDDCFGWHGRCLDLEFQPHRMIDVHCRCQNWNRCAACGESLSTDGLRARSFVYGNGRILHVAGFAAFGHTERGLCTDRKSVGSGSLLERLRRLVKRDEGRKSKSNGSRRRSA